jgi:hypothetical protein
MAAPQTDIMTPAAHASCASTPPHARQQVAVYRIVRNLRWAAMEGGHPATPEGLLGAAGINCTVSDADLDAIPKSGPVLIAVEGAFGILEGLVLAAALPKARADVKILANYVLAEVPGFESAFIAVDPWQGKRAVPVNRQAMAKAVKWLDGQGLLAVFPAGDGMAPPARHRASPLWSTTPLRLARMSGAPIVPVSLSGVGAPEAPNTEVEVRIGLPILWERLAAVGADETATEYVRWRAAALRRRHQRSARLVPRLTG